MGQDVKEKVKALLREVQPEVKEKDEEKDLQMNISGTGNIQAAGDVTIEIHEPENITISGPNIVDCPDCGQPVSKRADNCSTCGCPVNKHFQKIAAKRAVQAIGVVLVILTLLIGFIPQPYNLYVGAAAVFCLLMLHQGLRELTRLSDV